MNQNEQDIIKSAEKVIADMQAGVDAVETVALLYCKFYHIAFEQVKNYYLALELTKIFAVTTAARVAEQAKK